MEPWEKGCKIYSRDGKKIGSATGSIRHCTMEGCNGLRIYVRWTDKRITMPCSRGMFPHKDGYKIE